MMRQKKQSIFYFLIVLFVSQTSIAAPLGTIPNIDERDWRVILDFRSDLWTSPYSYKRSPVRILSGEFKIPIAHSEGWNISANISDESLSLSKTEFTLTDRNVFIGNNLQSGLVGLGLNRVYGDGSAFSVVGGYASASDSPYDSDKRNVWFEGTVTYRSRLVADGYRWIVAVNQSQNRGIANGIPFPIVGVMIEHDDSVTTYVGFPFFRMVWLGQNNWKREVHVNPFGAYIDVERFVGEGFTLHTHASYAVRAYLHEERLKDDDRIYYQEVSVEGALKKEISKTTTVSLGVGYSFERRIYESESIYEPRERKTPLDSDFYGNLRMEFNL